MTEAELIARVTREIMGLSDSFDSDNYADAVDMAEAETGFTCPVTSSFQIMWLIQRTKRALFFMLTSGASKKVRFEDVHRQQEFENLRKLIKDMDDDFERAKKDSVYEFAGVSAVHIFGTKIDAGFQYEDRTGAEATYRDDNKVIVSPSDGES